MWKLQLVDIACQRAFHSFCMAFIAIVVGLSGCGPSGPRLAEVRGVVKLDGKTLPDALITFQPQGGVGTYSSGMTDENGEYRMHYSRTRMGAMVGSHRVEITTAVEVLPPDGGDPRHNRELVPPQYNKQSDLIREVTDSPNQIDFDLESGGFPEKRPNK